MFIRRVSRRPGLTLIELLVVIAIIGVLLSLLLPAVQKVRGAADRARCAVNLQQIGTALHNFHSVKDGFPPATFDQPDKSQVEVHWIAYLLPYLEQEALFKEYHFDVRFDNAVNAGVIGTTIDVLLCPSAPGRPVGLNKRAETHYAATCRLQRPNPFIAPMPKPDPTFIGVLGLNVYRKITEITDGSSNTLLVAEVAGAPEEWMMGKFVKASGVPQAWAGPNSTLGLAGFNPVTMTTPGLCAINCYNKGELHSFHAGGANVLFADGSVRFQSAAQSDINVLAALLTRRYGEVVSLEAE